MSLSEAGDGDLACLDELAVGLMIRTAVRLRRVGGGELAHLFDVARLGRVVGHDRYRKAWRHRDNVAEGIEELRDTLNYLIFTLDQIEREKEAGTLECSTYREAHELIVTAAAHLVAAASAMEDARAEILAALGRLPRA